MPTASDAERLDELVAATQGGDKEAFSELVRRTQPALRSFLALRLANLEMLDEVEQATWVQCYLNLGRYRLEGSFLPWLCGFGRNLAARHIRQRYRHLTGQDEVLAILLEEQVDREEQEPSTRQIRREQSDQVQDCVGRLAPAARELIEARYFREQEVAEIAEAQQRSRNWVSVTLMRIRKSLKDCLEAKGALP